MKKQSSKMKAFYFFSLFLFLFFKSEGQGWVFDTDTKYLSLKQITSIFGHHRTFSLVGSRVVNFGENYHVFVTAKSETSWDLEELVLLLDGDTDGEIEEKIIQLDFDQEVFKFDVSFVICEIFKLNSCFTA